MRKEKSEHEKAKRVARKFLQAVRDHCSQKDDALQEMCNLEGADYNRVYSLIAFYVDEKDHSIRSNNLIAAYCLNDKGFKFSEIDFDFDFASRNANSKNDKKKGSVNKNTGDMEKSRVFIAHWIDDPFKSEVARLIEKLGFKAVLQEELPGEGKTIITQIIDELDKSCYGVVIYTYSDIGRRKDESDGKLRPRARQNVVLEHGMLISKLGLNKVCCLVTEGIEHPSDTNGILYVDLEKKDWVFNLAKNMKAAGLSVDMNKLYD